MSDQQWIIWLVFLVLSYKLVKWQEEMDHQPPFTPPPSEPKKAVQPSKKPTINRAEDDPLIIPPNISYHPPRVQTLIRLMWSDLNQLIKFKNEVDYYDTERWHKKKDLIEALSFTTYHQFKGFLRRWKGDFSAWPKWEKYLEEWESLT